MAFSREVRVNVTGDSRSLDRTFEKSARSSKRFERELTGNLGKADLALQRLGAGRAALIGGAAGAGAAIIAPKIINQLHQAVDVASNLNEQISKSRAVFGASSTIIEDWSETTARGIGVARDQAIEAAGTFGAMFRQAGQAGSDAANLSKNVVQLAGDLASFNNSSVDDALTALRSGLSGEIEPLRRFQVFLTEAAVQQRAMEQTGKDNAKQLTQGEKILARYSLIMEQTSRQQGDFQRTSKGLANQQRILTAEVRDLQGNLGKLLLPVMVKVTGALVSGTEGALKLAKALEALGNIRIPTIHIPFAFDIPGGSLAGRIGDLAVGFEKNLPFNRLFLEIAHQINSQLEDEAAKATPEAAAQSAAVMADFIDNVLTSATAQVKPTVDFNDLLGNVLVTAAPSGDVAGNVTSGLDKAISFARGALDDAIKKGRAAIAKDAREKAAEKQRSAFDDLIDAITLGVRRAEVTPGIRDDLRRNTQLQNAIKEQIKVEGRTTELAGMLFDARRDRAAILERKSEAASDAIQARQFRALGLSATGDDIVPGIKNLATRINQTLRNANLGKIDISSKLVARLKAARQLIKTEGGKLTEDTRRVINDFIKAATGQDSTRQGPLTRGSAINASKILEGLILPPGMEETLRARLSRLNSVAGAISAPRVPRGGSTSTFALQPVVESHITVTLDGDVVSRAVTRSQQRTRRRNPSQKRGPNVPHNI